MKRYCRVCGQSRAIGRFKHSFSVCLECDALPLSQQLEMEIIHRIRALPLLLSEEQVQWLEKMKNDLRHGVRAAALARSETESHSPGMRS